MRIRSSPATILIPGGTPGSLASRDVFLRLLAGGSRTRQTGRPQIAVWFGTLLCAGGQLKTCRHGFVQHLSLLRLDL